MECKSLNQKSIASRSGIFIRLDNVYKEDCVSCIDVPKKKSHFKVISLHTHDFIVYPALPIIGRDTSRSGFSTLYKVEVP